MESHLGDPRHLFRGSFGAFGDLLGAFWGPLGASSGHFAVNHSLLQRLGHDLECFGGRLGAILGRHGALFGTSWGPVGPSWGSLGLSGCPFGTIFGASRAVPDARKTEEPSSQTSHKNHKKIYVFCVPNAPGGWSLGRLLASGGCWGPLEAFAGLFGHPPDRFGPAGQARQGRPKGPEVPGNPLQERPGGPQGSVSGGSRFGGGQGFEESRSINIRI